MANEKVLKGPYWTRNWIEAMWRFTNENFVDFDTGAIDYEALGKEEFQFRKALFFRNFKNSERAKMAFASAKDDYKNSVENGKKGGRPKKSPQDAPNGNAGVDMSDAGNGAASKSPTSCDQFTADGDIREDSQDRKSGTSANHYGDAATREGAEVVDSRESGASAPTTVSRNMRRVPQNEAPAHGFSGGRTAQGTMSRSPEAAAQSGKDYDQFTADGDIREDSLAKPDGSAITRNETRAHDALEPSANLYGPRQAKNGDAPRREAGEAFTSRESGASAPTTVSGQFRGSAKNQGESNTGSTVPAVCPESGDISKARQGQARESRRTGGSSVRGMAKVAQPSVRSRAKNSRCPNSREDFHAFVADNKLHEGLAEEWYAMHEARGWVDRDGKPIKEWKGALYNYCTKTEQKRRTA